jgi:hypothetical protein|tara:strand:+ start:146 stop:664 length:519 start_codon:yes stop_codon:yes gene_type:complete
MSSSFTGNPTNLLSENYIIPEDESEKDLKLRQYLNNIATATNTKDSGIYDGTETITGQRFLPTFSSDTGSNATYRSVFRIVVDTGALANTGTTSIAHGITTQASYSLVKMYGAATDPGASTWTAVLPLPYAHPTAANNIALDADATNINITTGSNRSAFTRSFVVLEYIQVT